MTCHCHFGRTLAAIMCASRSDALATSALLALATAAEPPEHALLALTKPWPLAFGCAWAALQRSGACSPRAQG